MIPFKLDTTDSRELGYSDLLILRGCDLDSNHSASLLCLMTFQVTNNLAELCQQSYKLAWVGQKPTFRYNTLIHMQVQPMFKDVLLGEQK